MRGCLWLLARPTVNPHGAVWHGTARHGLGKHDITLVWTGTQEGDEEGLTASIITAVKYIGACACLSVWVGCAVMCVCVCVCAYVFVCVCVRA